MALDRLRVLLNIILFRSIYLFAYSFVVGITQKAADGLGWNFQSRPNFTLQ